MSTCDGVVFEPVSHCGPDLERCPDAEPDTPDPRTASAGRKEETVIVKL